MVAGFYVKCVFRRQNQRMGDRTNLVPSGHAGCIPASLSISQTIHAV